MLKAVITEIVTVKTKFDSRKKHLTHLVSLEYVARKQRKNMNKDA